MTIGQRGVSIVITFILAAVLGPRDFGVVAMALAYIIFIEMFVAQGMEPAIIQRPRLLRLQLDTLFWFIVIWSILLAGLSVLLSGWWAAVNHLPELNSVITVLSASLVLRGVAVVPSAILQRQMAFKRLALASTTTSLAGGIAGLGAALLGAGVWALVTQHLITSTLELLAFWRMSDWRPRPRFRLRCVRSMYGFGGSMILNRLGAYVASQSDILIVGALLGPVAAGLYRLSDRLMRTVLEIGTRSVQVVSLPHFASLQHDEKALRVAVLSSLRVSVMATAPVLAVLFAAAEPLMQALGERWADAAPILQVLVFLGMAKSATLFIGPLLLAINRPFWSAILIWGLGLLTACAIAITVYVLDGMKTTTQCVGIAAVRTAVFVIFTVVALSIIGMFKVRLSALEAVSSLIPAFIASLAAVLMGFLFTHFRAPTPFIQLCLVAAPSALIGFLVLVLSDHQLRNAVWSRFCNLRWASLDCLLITRSRV